MKMKQEQIFETELYIFMYIFIVQIEYFILTE